MMRRPSILPLLEASGNLVRRNPYGGTSGSSVSPHSTVPAEIDLVISSGGLRGFYMIGCRHALQNRNVTVNRISGASSGAWCGFFMAVNLSPDDWLHTYEMSAWHAGKGMPLLNIYRNYVWPWLSAQLPDDAHKRCTDKLHITMSEHQWRFAGYPRAYSVSRFESNQELFDACAASSTIPLITERGFGPKFHGKRVSDAVFSDNCPIFAAGTECVQKLPQLPQLVVRLDHLNYPFQYCIKATDPCIEALIVRGAVEMSRFLNGEESEVISWHKSVH